MLIIFRRTLREFWERHPDSEQLLNAWFAEAQAADWKNPQGIKRRGTDMQALWPTTESYSTSAAISIAW